MNKNFNPISLEGTVVGILFKKTGEEIKEAINNKIEDLSEDIEEYQATIEDVDAFLEQKETELEGLDELYQDRRDEKEGEARPFRRQVDDIHKAWADKEFIFNRETESLVGKIAVKLEKGFDKFEKRFDELDELYQDVNVGITSELSMRSSTSVMPGVFTNAVDSGFMSTADNAVSIQSTSNFQKIGSKTLLPSKQDKALARINTLRSQVNSYRSKVTLIKNRIITLETEVNELDLIQCHLNDKDNYTLDLTRLTSLGFVQDTARGE